MKQILCFGDSNTYGLIPGTTNRYQWGIRWSSLLSEAVADKGYRVIEEGLCGRTTIFNDPLREGRRGSDLLPILLETHKPIDMVILMLGTNDCKSIYAASAEGIGKGIKKLLDQIEQEVSLNKVLLISPIQLGEYVWQEVYDKAFSKTSVEVSKGLGDVYEQIAYEKNIAFLRASDYAACSSVDQEHLDEAGHKKLAQAIYQKLEPILTKN